MTDQTMESYYRLLRRRLSPRRLIHSEGVMREAEELARIHGADPEKAKIAGLLHDMTKEFSREEHFRLLEKYNVPVDEESYNNENLWHALSASVDLTECFGITDPDLCSAVRYHTTGRPEMTLLETVLYVADAIEPNRNYSDLGFYRAVAREDLYKAAYLITLWALDSIKARGLPLHRDTERTCAWLKRRFPSVTLESEQKRIGWKGI